MPALLPSPIQTKSMRVFIVEDHLDTANSLRGFLKALGHTVLCAGSMDWALQELPRSGCDVLLCNVMLPDGDGRELWRQIKGQLARPTYAVAMSACVQPADHVQEQGSWVQPSLRQADRPHDADGCA